MSNYIIAAPALKSGWEPSEQTLAASITQAASQQTYSIVRFLVDREWVPEAYCAYAYFRWVDDYLDQEETGRVERIAFINRHQQLLDCGYHHNYWPDDLSPEEEMLRRSIVDKVNHHIDYR